MKITDVEVLRMQAFTEPQNNWLFVRIHTDEGISGLGEGSLQYKDAALAAEIENFALYLRGKDPFQIEDIWTSLHRRVTWSGGAVTMSAISAIDLALWDIKGKALNQPVYMLLGGRMRDKVVCYKGIGGRTPADSARSARRRVDQGWKFLRLSVVDRDGILEPRTAVRDSVAHFAAVREEVGPEIEIVIDYHTRLDPPDAIKLGRELEPYDPFFLEDPLRCENPQTYRQIRQHVSAPLAVGEHYATKWEFRQMIEEELLDYARIDLCIVGGLTEARKIANWCETHYIKIVPHNPLGPVSAAACLHLDLACDNFAVQEAGLVGDPVMEDLFPLQVPYENGYLLPPQSPGLGIEFNEEAAQASYGFQWQNGPQLRRKDGSFTNW